MRRLALGLGMAFFCLCCSSSFGANASNDNLNSRIKSLQERLKQFQNREYADAEDKMVAEEEIVDLILDRASDSILPISEKPIDNETAARIVEDLENRSDVAMTVLFHDSEFDNLAFGANKDFAMIEPPKVIIEDSPEDRQQFYESLRQKVLQATRNTKSDSEEIRQQLASLN